MRNASGLFIAISLVLLNLNPQVVGSESPGRIGVYAGLEEESKSPETLRQTMKRIKATGIDFIHCSGKDHFLFWDSQIAPKEAVKDPTYLEKILQCAH